MAAARPQPPPRTKITTAALREMKQQRERIVALTAYDHLFAGLLDQAGIDVVLVGDSMAMVVQGRDTTVSVTMDQTVYHCELVARACKRALVVGDLPFLSYQVSTEDALRSAGRLLKEGLVEAVKLEGGAPVLATVARLVEAGIPVMGHLGLTPQSIHQFGSYKARGIDPAEQRRIVADAKGLEQAGAFALVLEKVPAALGRKVAKAVTIPVIGIGAGPHVDGQILVTADMLGLFSKFRPRFVRRYAELGKAIDSALRAFGADVRQGAFPGPDESY
ncbi:MAG: 3-methyl-2-oxobutanoate hydroxymethyltransferase [Planctomycetes bacterium]|nr:3-methyl-2-oxobutanoate hydroxymethyltransferase [Planctomycetota bacterium]